MKNRIFLSFLGAALLLGSCIRESETVEVKSLTLDKTALSLVVGDNERITATVLPNDADNKAVTWSSIHEDIATVSNSGTVVALKEGHTVIVVKASSNGVSSYCEVDVHAEPVPLQYAKLSVPSLNLSQSGSDTLLCTVYPDDTTEKISWSSSDNSVAIVSDGVVFARNVGESTIFVVGPDGDALDSCRVTVVAEVYPLEEIGLAEHNIDMFVMESDTIDFKLYPTNTTEGRLQWTSSDPQVAVVSYGVVTALREGQAMIYASGANGTVSDSCLVSVHPFPMNSIRLSNHNMNLYLMDSDTLEYSTDPDNVDDIKVKWTSSDNQVAIVNNGVVTALREGKATVVVSDFSGRVADTCCVNVTSRIYPLEKVTLSKHSVSLYPMESDTLVCSLYPEYTTDYKVRWTSSDDKVAIVNGGIITALREGNVTITVSGADGSIADICEVSVIPHTYPLQKLTLSKHDVTLYEMESETILCTLTPQNTTDDNIQWTSDDSQVAVVTNGTVTALRAGKTTVSAIGAGGNIVDKCDITVLCNVSGVKLSKHQEVCETGRSFALSANVYPSRAENRQVNWKSSNELVATVNQGTVRTGQAGEAYIIVTTVDGEFSDSCLLQVVNPVSGLSMDSTSVSIFEGDEFDLEALVLPLDARNTEISWVSSDASVASVNSEGHVVALLSGQTTIVAVTKEGGYVRTCAVNVFKHVNDIRFSFPTDTVALYQDESMILEPLVLPEEAPNKELAWISSNTGAVVVDQFGRVTAKGQGVATVTVTSKDNPDITSSIIVRVKKHVESVTVEEASPIYEGQSLKLSTAIYPSDADDQKLTFTSDDTDVATVSADGTVSAVRAGTAYVTVVSNDGKKTAKCKITVLCHVSSVEIETQTITGFVNTEIPLNVTVLPERATNKNVKWESLNEDVAMITREGKLRLWAPGTATIKVTSEDNPLASATMTVKVSVHSESVVIDQATADLFEGESVQLSAEIKPYNDPSLITWSSSDPSVATVSATGLVEARKLGKITVKAQANDNAEHYAICTVNVKRHVTSVSITSAASFIFKGTDYPFKATVYPSDASEKTVIWSSSDEKVAKVDSNGRVSGVGVGSATITATTTDGQKTASRNITVEPCIDRVEVAPSDQYMDQYSEGILSWYLEDGAIPLEATVYPSDYPNSNVSWSSNKKTVIDVVNGQIIPKLAGTAVVTATTEGVKNNNEYATASITVRVKEHVRSVSLSDSEISMYAGDSYTLVPEILPSTADDDVAWNSSDKNVAIVSEGIVTAIGPGTAKITVITLDGSKTATCMVKVEEAITRITSIKFASSSQVLKKGSVLSLSPVILPADATKTELHWTVSDPSVIKLLGNDAANINVQAMDYGENITVTATATDGSGISAVCTITVPTPVKVSEIELNPGTLTLVEQTGKASLTASVYPSDAENKTITWSSDDTSVATVSGTGSTVTVSAKSPGFATITATAADGSGTVGTCIVEVIENVLIQTIRLYENGKQITSKNLYVGETYVLPEPQINPSDASNKQLSYQPEQGGRITYSNGIVTAIKAGSSSITISATDGSGAYCQLNFNIMNRPVQYVSLDRDDVTVKPGKTFTLVPSFYPANATIQTVTWESDNTSVATVSSKGVVTAKTEGTTYITVTTTDGGKTAKCKVTVANVSTGEDVGFEDWN